MKKIILLLIAFIFSFNSYSQLALQDFEAAAFPPTLPANWAVFDNGVNALPAVNWATLATPAQVLPLPPLPFVGVKSAYMNRPGNIGANNTSQDFLVTPLTNIPTNGQIRFFTRTLLATQQPATKYQIRIKLQSAGAQNDPAGYNLVTQWTDANLVALYNVFEEKTVSGLALAPYLNQPVYVAFCMEYTQPATAPVGNRWLIDNVQIVQECLNPAVASLNAAPILATSATLNWATTAGSSGYQIENVVQFGTFTGNPTGSSLTNSFVQTNLSGSTCYQFKVRSDCGSGNFGTWVGPFSYCTSVAPPVCGGVFTDSGGIAANYANNENSTVTVLPINATDQVTVNFINFATESGFDFLRIYDGNSVATGTLLGTFSGNTNPGTFTGSTASGALTFVFTSDSSGLAAGWNASVTCNPPPACQKPSALISSNITVTSFTIGWTNLGLVDSSQVLVLPCNAPAPTAASTGWTPATANTLTLINQASGTCFNIYVRSACPGGLLSTWAGPIIINTLIAPPICGGNFVDTGGIAGNYSNNENYTLTIPPTIAGEQVTVTFTAFNTESNFDELEIYDGTTAGTLLGTFSGIALPPAFTASTLSGELTFVFQSDGSVNGIGWQANVTCAPPPTCKKPLNLQTSLVTATSVTLSWTQPANPNGSTATTWQVIAVPCSATAPLANNPNWITTTNNPYQFNGLNSNTCYDFYVKAVCSPTDISVISVKTSVNTLIVPPGCGGNFYDLGGLAGDYLVSSNSTTIICPTNPGQIVTVTFTAFNTEANWDGLYVFDGNNLNAPQIASNNPPANVPGGLAGSYWGTTIPGPFTSTSPDGCLTFNFRSDASVVRAGWAANVTCTNAPTCARPYLLNVTNTTQTTATLGWTQLPNFGGGTATAWEILILPAGSAIPTTAGIPTTTNPYLVTGLTPGTAYVYYVRAVCSNSDQSIWSAFNFATTPLNDECTNATFAVVNQNLNCTQTTPGTLSGATQSVQTTTCPGNVNDDVWFTFTATAATHIISFNNAPANADLDYGIFQGTSCGTLTEIGCNSAANLVAGTTYFIRVYSSTAAPQFTNFNLCIGTLPCTEAPAFCTGQTVTYANTTNVPSLGQIGCLFTSPNPAFFFLQVNQAGPLSYLISQVDNGGTPRDVDYVAWGPFTDLSTACSGVPANPLAGILPAPTPAAGCPGGLHACSYSTAPQEIMCIPNAQLCEVYVIMITNFSNQAGSVTFSQTNTGGGTTSCFPINTFNYSKTIYCTNEIPNAIPVLANGASSGTYTSTPAGLSLNSVTGIVTLATSLPGTYIVTSTTLTSTGGACTSIPSIITTRTIVIEAPATGIISYVAPAKWCNNDTVSKTVTLVGTPNGSYSATPAGLSINPSTGAILPVASAPGIYNVVYTVAANPSGGCPTFVSAPFEVEILATPIINAPNNQIACLNYTLPVLTVGNYYTLANGAGTLIPAGSVITNSQTVHVFATNTNCSINKFFTVTIGAVIIPITSFTYPTQVCKNGTNPVPTTATGFTTGGIYSCSNPLLSINPSTGVINLSSPANTYTVTYTTSANTTTCLLAGSTNFDITILPLNSPLNGFSYTIPVCKNGTNPTPILDSGFIGGGVFSCTNPLLSVNPSTGLIDLSSSPAGTYTINYNLSASTNVANCYAAVSSSAQIIINPVITSVSTLTYPSSTVCTLGANILPTLTTIFSSDGVVMTTLPTFPIIITYSVTPISTATNPGLDLNPTTGEINLANSQPGNYVITVSITGNPGNCYAGSIKTFNLNVNAPTIQNTDFNYISPVCKSSSINPIPNPTVGFATGGTYSSTQTALLINPSTGEINLASPVGTYDVIYTLNSDSVLCLSGGSTTKQIKLLPVKTPLFAQITPICQGTTAPLLPMSSNDTPAITGSWNTVINTSAVGSLTYTFTPDPNQCASTTSMSISIVAPSIVPTFTPIAPICESTTALPTLPLVSTNTPAITGSWLPSTITSNVVGNGIYKFTPDAGQCAVSKEITINTKALPIFGITQECKGPLYTLDIVPVLTNATFSWQNSANLIPNGSSAVVSALGSYTCEVTVNGCTKSVTFKVTNVTCEIQKGISPNGDNKNEEFDLSTLNVKQLDIFNRYGSTVYSKTSYSKEWVGQSNANEILPDGTYYYVVELGDGTTKTGWVYINKENK